MYPYLLPEWFEERVPLYDLFIVIGIFALMIYIAYRCNHKENFSHKDTNKILYFVLISLGVALVTSFLVDGIFHTIHNHQRSFGSISFIGGLIGGLSTFIFLIWFKFTKERKQLIQILNTVIVGVVLGHAIGRIGCFLAGCCYGIPTESLLGVVFPYGESLGIKVFPTQLFESIFLFGLFIGLTKIKRAKQNEIGIYLIGYGLFRFLIEFIRGDNRGTLFAFIETQYNSFPSPSQYLSLLMITAGIYYFVQKRYFDTVTNTNK